jgi:NAD+ synthase (glutamine-hydrolysing)
VRLIKAAAAAVNQTPLDWRANKRNLVAAMQAAKAEGVGVLCLPELCITGYGCEDAFQSPGIQQTALAVLAEILPETRGLIVSLGLPLAHGGALFNMAALAVDGELIGCVGKQHLTGEGVHYEPRWFKPWPKGQRAAIRFADRDVPIGDLLFDVGGIRIGFEICEDAWVASRPGGALAAAGADLLLNPSASHFAFGKQEIRERFVLEGSRAFGVSYVYANLLGNEAGRIIYDGGRLIASAGKMVARGRRFSYADFELTSAVVDIDATRMARSRVTSAPVASDDGVSVVSIDLETPSASPVLAEVEPESWERDHVKEEEFARTVSLGLFDYLRKSCSRGFVVSLSGGADSAATAALCALMVRFGVADIGMPAFLTKLRHIPELKRASSEKEVVARLLTCAYQATRNSSRTTRDAAKAVADEIGAEFLVFDVDGIVESYVDLIAKGIGRPLAWETDDLALQNIQARSRAPSVWLLANLRSALLLSTSNRSEAAVGYATMDGDTSGGLCPIAGIDKAFLRHWLKWLETTGPAGIGGIPALKAVNDQQPTAELRPREAGQTDEDDLMPYTVLDAIERAAIRDKHSPIECFQLLQPAFARYSTEQLGMWVERFFKLWCRNQWKRERYAPSFHLDDENLDPKTWCRFPILSGGFARELAELREFLDRA